MNNQIVLTVSAVAHTYNITSISGSSSSRVAAESTPTLPERMTISHQELKQNRRRSLLRFEVNYSDTSGTIPVTRTAYVNLVIDKHVPSCTEATADLLQNLVVQFLSTESLTDAFALGEV